MIIMKLNSIGIVLASDVANDVTFTVTLAILQCKKSVSSTMFVILVFKCTVSNRGLH